MAATRMSSPKSRSERRFSEIRLRSPHDSGAVDDADQERLARDMRTHVTRFFKGPADFEALMEHVFPALLSQPQPEVALRIWTPGCGTGEETYSVAIALYEFLGTRSDTIPIQIFGTDISQSAINAARFGLYSDSIADDLSPRLQRYFIKEDRGCRIRQDVRELCVFAEQDLTRDPPFSRLDLVLWRDVLVLLSPVVQRRVLSIFHYALKPSGFLMLGETESVESVGDLYSVHDKKKRIYTRKPIETPRDAYVMGAKHLDASSFSQIRSKPEARSNVQSEMNRIILDRFGPPGVMVDADYQIVHVRGDVDPFVAPPRDKGTWNLIRLARERLGESLRTTLSAAKRRNGPVRREGLSVWPDGNRLAFAVEVVPVERYFLVLFDAEDTDEEATSSKLKKRGLRVIQPEDARSRRVAELEEELDSTRDQLHSIILGAESANQELQAATTSSKGAN